MNIYYVSLVQCLVGKCIKVEASDETKVRKYANENYGKLWCSVYDDCGDMEVIGEEYLG